MMNNSPIFITGMYRCGTTLLSKILNSHHELSITYDSLHFMRYYYKKFGKEYLLKKNINLVVDSVTNRIEKRTGKKISKENIKKKLNKKKKINYNFLYQIIMFEFLIAGTKSKKWGEKTNIAWTQIPNFLKMFKSGKVIFLIRDPRDILVSYKRISNYKDPEYLHSIFLSLGCFQFIEKYNFHNSIFVMRYEDLISNPNAKLKEICSFLNINFKKSLLNNNNYLESDGSKWKPNTSFKKNLKGFSKSPIGRWKKNISNEDLFLCEIILKNYLKKFNYEYSNNKFNENIFRKIFNKINKSKNLVEKFEYWLSTGNGQNELMYKDW